MIFKEISIPLHIMQSLRNLSASDGGDPRIIRDALKAYIEINNAQTAPVDTRKKGNRHASISKQERKYGGSNK